MSVTDQSRKSAITIIRIASRLLLVLGILSILLFLPAGRWDWPQAWVLIFSFGVFLLLYVCWGIYKDPELFHERSRVAKNAKSWDRVIMAVYAALLPMIFIIAGIDVGRFGWSVVPAGVQVFAWIGLVLGAVLIFWTITTNTYLSRQARIQDDRGQKVVASGPYSHVRHPMYLGILIVFLSIPVALGSWYALIPCLAIDSLFVVRTAKEDKMLREELPGYEDYTRCVHYRLIPGIW